MSEHVEKERTSFVSWKKKNKKNKQTTEQERNENELKVTWNDSIDVVILNILCKAKLDLKIQNRQQVFLFSMNENDCKLVRGELEKVKFWIVIFSVLVSRQKKQTNCV